ncbi:MAG: class I SAM-dependent methyltransferase [Candidatus Nanoarchaeia archaeon]
MALRTTSKEQFIGTYESTATSYDTRRSTTFEGRVVDERQISLLRRLIKKSNAKKICEAGCGTGRIMVPLSKLDIECHGFDPSKNMLKQLKDKKPGKNVHLKTGDIEKIPYKANTFDLTYTMHVLMHLPDHKKAFNEMYRITKPGGLVVCDFPNKNSIWTKLSILLSPSTPRTRLFTKKELTEFFKDHKFQVTGIFSYARTFYKIPILRHLVYWLERNLPLPVSWRTQLIFIVRKT